MFSFSESFILVLTGRVKCSGLLSPAVMLIFNLRMLAFLSKPETHFSPFEMAIFKVSIRAGMPGFLPNK